MKGTYDNTQDEVECEFRMLYLLFKVRASDSAIDI